MQCENINHNRRPMIGAMVLAFLFSLAQIMGEVIENQGQFFPFIKFFLLAVVFYVIINFLMKYLIKNQGKAEKIDNGTKWNKKHWLIIWLVLNAIGFIALLGVYPGFACYDFNEQMTQMQIQTFTAHHPLLHTIFMTKIITTIGNAVNDYNFGGFCYCFLQMMMITGCFTWVLKNLYEMGMKKRWVIVSAIFYGLLPTNLMFLLCTTKDSLFTAVLICNMVFLKKILMEKEKVSLCDTKEMQSKKREMKSQEILFVGTALLASLLRNNMVYAYIACIFFVFYVYRRKAWKIIGMLITVVMGTFLCNMLLTSSLSADQISTAEMLSVPVQQLARAVNEKGEDFFTPEELDALYGFINKEGIDAYDALVADPVKSEINSSGDAAVDFIKLWVKIGLEVPTIYLDATLENTYQAWYPNALIDGYCNSDTYRYDTLTSYFSGDVEAPLSLDSKIPGIYSFFWNVARNGLFQNIPIIKYLFSIGAYLWILLFAFVYAIVAKQKSNMIMLGLILLFCSTNLLGPIVLVRYYLVLFWACPIVGYSLFEKNTFVTSSKNT